MVVTRGPLLELAPDSLLVSSNGERSMPGTGVAASPSTAPRSPSGPSTSVATSSAAAGAASLEDVRRQHLLRALERCDWVIEGPSGAARLLGLQPSTLRSRLKKLGLQQ